MKFIFCSLFFMMDVGGLNGALLDPMTMTDAELLDVPSLPDIEETLNQVEKLDDVTSVLGQNTVMDSGRLVELEALVCDKDTQIGSLNTQVTQLKDENSKLSEKVELYDDEITDLREQFNKLESKTEEQSVKIKQLEDQRSENEAKITSLEAEAGSKANAGELEEKVTMLENKIKQMETDSAALTKRNQDLIGNKNQKIAELNAAIAENKTTIEEKDKQKMSLEEKFKEVEGIVEGKDTEIKNLQKTISDLKQCNDAMAEKDKELADLKSQMDEMSLKQKSISDEKSKLETDNKILSEKVSKTDEIAGNNENLSKEIEEKQKQLDNLKTHMDESKKELQDTNTKLEEKQKELAEKTKESQGQEEKIRDLTERVEKLNQNEASWKQSLISLNEEKEALKSSVADYDKKSEDLIKKIEELEKSKSALEAEKADLSTRLANNEQKGLEMTLVKTQLAETQKREAKLKTDVHTLSDKLTKVDAEKQLFSSEVTKAVQASKMFEEQLKSKAMELETTKKHKLSLEQAAGNYVKLSHEKAAVDQRCQDLTKRCGDMERKVQQVKTLEQQVMGLNSANVQMNNELHKVKHELSGVKQHNNNLSSECNNLKIQVDQNNKYMRDYSIQNGELQKKNIELSNVLKGKDAECVSLKSQIDKQTPNGDQKRYIDSLSQVLVETRTEAEKLKNDCEVKDKDLVNSRVEIDRLNKEVLILQKSNEMNQSKKKKQQHNTDDDSKDSIIKELKKDLEAARRANSKLEKELIDKDKQLSKVSSSSMLFSYLLNFGYFFSLGHQVNWINSSRKQKRNVRNPLQS